MKVGDRVRTHPAGHTGTITAFPAAYRFPAVEVRLDDERYPNPVIYPQSLLVLVQKEAPNGDQGN